MNNAQILQLLKWDIDHLVFLSEYNAYYCLAPALDKDGKRIGITSCCELGVECERHKEFRLKIESQKAAEN